MMRQFFFKQKCPNKTILFCWGLLVFVRQAIFQEVAMPVLTFYKQKDTYLGFLG